MMVTWTRVVEEKVIRIGVGFRHILKAEKQMVYTEMSRASPVAQMVKNLAAMQETQVQSLGQEDPLEKGMATHSSCLEHSMGRGA